MKKTIYLMGAALAVMSMSACCGNGKCSSGKHCGKGDAKELYAGVLPAADADGVRYVLHLDYDDDNCKEGDYELVETHLEADTTNAAGYKDGKTFRSEGDFKVIAGNGVDKDKKYLKLEKDSKDSSAGSAEGPLYFYVESDSTLVMVNSDLKVSENPALNYTLKLQK